MNVLDKSSKANYRKSLLIIAIIQFFIYLRVRAELNQ
jgi:hypothetical protein